MGRADHLHQLHTLSRIGAIGNASDGSLLGRFLEGPEETSQAAFSALVDRHGPMVLRVCRQRLGDLHDAQDAYQATFLVLARRARSVRRSDSLASWLYGVALRVAKRAGAEASRRAAREQQVALIRAEEQRPASERNGAEPWAEIHDEISRLPERYRHPLVLCYLEGLTAEAAAARLGCPRGTVLSRLSRARERLRARLTRRGLVFPAGPFPASAKINLPASVSEGLIRDALRVIGVTTVGSVPPSVSLLTEGTVPCC